MPPTTSSRPHDEPTSTPPLLRETRDSAVLGIAIAGSTFESSALDLDGYDELPFTD